MFKWIKEKLFGSFARGTQNEDSDIDVAVILETVEGDLLDKKARLYKIRSYGEILYTKSAKA